MGKFFGKNLIFWPLMGVSILAWAALVNVQHPTEYTNGAPLKQEDISHYEVCYELPQSDTCDKVVQAPVVDTLETPCWAGRVKARTVMRDSALQPSDWSEYLELTTSCGDGVKPMPPVLSFGGSGL